MLTKQELLQPLASLRTDEVVVTTMGAVRPWSRFSDSPLDFASADSAMGHVADLALGIALAQPQRKVICLNGDGSLLMTLGSLATVVEAGAPNLILFTVENRTFEITGNQAIAGAGRVDFTGLAQAAGFARTYAFDDPANYARTLPTILREPGPVFVNARVEPGSEGPLSRSRKGEPVAYLQPSLAESAHRLRKVLTE
ncbi:MAG: thiamine pyrophosphate-dependent enzyme [Acidobacteriota bacterium]|nr:thiamine pyrophosphate-dependent enzyme [Acidobacteriota bacterium]